ncbi:MAG: DnaJ C-terminal domain-containing protein [Acidobacteriota bacterium]|nr:MAG: DnaJ C-terminal domain-containing protein [Acidobacteriota bacterium]
MDYKDYYQVLGIAKNANEKDIKQAFRKLARKHHPDVNPGDRGAEEKFKEINEAHEVLSDPDKRRKYDQLGANWKQYEQQGRPGPGGFGGGGFNVEFESGGGGAFSDFFRTFFEGGVEFDDVFGQAGGSYRGTRPGGRRGRGPQGFGQPPPQPGRDVTAQIEVTLEEAFHGTVKRLTLDGQSIDVRLKKGVKDGSKVRVAGKGERGAAGPGDLYLDVKMRAHHIYRREGDDLYVDVPVTVSEAALGAEIEVPTMAGKVGIKVPAGSQNGRLMRLKGKGMPKLKAKGHGDLFAKLMVVVPKKLSAREEELLKELATLDQRNPRAHLGCT